MTRTRFRPTPWGIFSTVVLLLVGLSFWMPTWESPGFGPVKPDTHRQRDEPPANGPQLLLYEIKLVEKNGARWNAYVLYDRLPNRAAGEAALREVYEQLRTELLANHAADPYKRLWVSLHDDARIWKPLRPYFVCRVMSSEEVSPDIPGWPPPSIRWRRRDPKHKPADREVEIFADYHRELWAIDEDTPEAYSRVRSLIAERWGVTVVELETIAAKCNLWFGASFE